MQVSSKLCMLSGGLLGIIPAGLTARDGLRTEVTEMARVNKRVMSTLENCRTFPGLLHIDVAWGRAGQTLRLGDRVI